ncbi:MAG TPA: WhiB family transcriptional regulator [Ilumatobacteraceae bacterium]|jgi:WhiB family transcriptional regulator, redox-sensing transcriptional regulator|nr:WhiB family transcriptional regulator [Ilumatobacteraceae bacterium]
MSAVEWPEIEIQLPRGVDWREYAACGGRLELFFGKVAERPQARMRREAKARKLCDTCVVRQPCRDFARENREYGFWGGENEEDRYLAGYPVTAAIGVRVRLAREEAAG